MKLLDTIISVILITQNDEDIIQERIKEINKELKKLHASYEIVIVDNNSTDQTVEKLHSLHKTVPHTRMLVLSKEYDTEIALTAGLDNCVGDYVILFNIYTDPPEVVPTIISRLLENYDIVIGESKYDIIKRSFLSKIFLKVIEKLSTHALSYRTNYLTALSRKAINSIIRTRRKSRNFNYIHYLIGYKKSVLVYKPIKKFYYKLKKENFFELFFAVTDIIISNSFRPIRMLTFLGMAASLFFLLYVFFITLLAIFFDTRVAPQGWISLATVLGSMFFLLFSLLTLISEYLIRVLNEARNEPFYFIADEIDRSIILPKKNRRNIA
ncbi:MAG: hypothetical protein A3D74_00670 [Candidatus Levybacteria bacterium RIFCSPHIGHO2_02_FULL_37_13]|nr:MAG: hypothetical protein A3D74_00670 [Candidatus Levybacteria bacterium RIFCSPHIGHO2_02_FULL_37_13]OGH30728.1 MAG: hypothetical protein A3E40_00700 [Candidatus Levybacteria bacterium RIFCSPHIGHO2_12_FULL_37_9]OGH37933.1 MAG: hypothetical protein A3B41_04965 [Candidatus Levybacteria bacterium RIFCSPLOWO2_01_FULL_37_26]